MPPSNPQSVLELSPFLTRLDQRHPDWLPDLAASGRLDKDSPPQAAALETAITKHGLEAGLRRFRNHEMMRITWREISGIAPLKHTLADLTGLAEVCLEAALGEHHARLSERHGTPRDAQGRPMSLVVLGLGKLGGGELNLSSDIDLVLCYPAAGQCDGARELSCEQYFTRLVRAVVGSLADLTEDGFCFRVDTRLRPFGEAGPLVCSFGALEQYYQREGRDWERYALVKARPVAGDRASGDRLLAELSPFIYRRYIDFGAVEALRDMLDAIRADARRRDRGNDVKRGPGGIREVEFLVQCVQLLRGGREPALRTPSLDTALDALHALELFPAERVKSLRESYSFLRRLENAIQAQHDQQTHRLPEGEDLKRIVRIMDEVGEDELLARVDETRTAVSTALDESFPRRASEPAPAGAWRKALGIATESPWHGFRQQLGRLALSHRAERRLDQFMPLLQDCLDQRNLPEAALKDVQALVLAICRRSAYLSLLVQNPPALARMVDLFIASDWVSATVVRYPALLDELIDPALGRDLPGRDELEATARRLAGRHDDTEAAVDALNYLKRAQSLRVAVAELEDVIPSTQAECYLTELAEVLLQQCLELAENALARRHGRPPGDGLAIIGYGSLGAGDISYGSDLDLVFLYPAGAGESDGARPLTSETWYTRLVRRLLALATTVSPAGRLYEVDTRLRPNGRAGLLVSPLSAFERYQHDHAWVWEWQALTRARPVAGNADLGRQFRKIRDEVLARSREDAHLAEEVPAMRSRMRGQIVSDDAFKHGPGGLLDIDFVAQLGVLQRAPEDATLREATDTRTQLTLLGEIGWLGTDDAATLVSTHRELTRARHLTALCRDGCGAAPDTTASRTICARFGL